MPTPARVEEVKEGTATRITAIGRGRFRLLSIVR